MSNFLEGKKTYISLAILLAGMVGATQYITNAEIAEGIDALLKLIGIMGAVYGRYVAKPKHE